MLGVQVVGPRRRQALPQQEQRGGPARSPPRPPAAPHGSGRPQADGRPAPASRLAPRPRPAPPRPGTAAARALRCLRHRRAGPGPGRARRPPRWPGWGRPLRTAEESLGRAASSRAAADPLSLPRRRGSGFSPPRPRLRGCCGRGTARGTAPYPRAGHGPVGRRHPDPRPRRGSEGLGPAPLSSPHLTSAAVHLPGGRRGGAAGGRPGGGGERFGGRGRRESQRAFPKNSPPTFPPQLPLKRPGPVSSVSCSRSPSPLSTSRGAPAKRRPIFGGGWGWGTVR